MVNLGAQIDAAISEIGDSAELGKSFPFKEAEQVEFRQKNIERVLLITFPLVFALLLLCCIDRRLVSFRGHFGCTVSDGPWLAGHQS